MSGLERFEALSELAEYIIPYFIFIISITLLLIIRTITKSLLIDILLLSVIILFGGLKVPFTWDLENYRYMFENPQILSITWIEPIFILSVNAIHLLSDSYLLFFLFYELITVLFIYFSIKEIFKNVGREFIFAWLTFLCFPFLFLNSFGVEIRQVLAYSIFLYASINWIYDKRKKALIFFIISMISHYSAIFAVIIWIISIIFLKCFFSKIRNKGMIFFLAITAAFFLSFYIDKIFVFILSNIPLPVPVKEKYISYLIKKEVIPISKLLVFNMIGLIIAMLINKVSKTDSFKMYSFYFVLVGILLLNLSFYFAPVSRIAYYFLVYLVISIPYISKLFKPLIISNFLLYIFLILLFLYGLFYITPYGNYAFLPCKSLIYKAFQYVF